MQQELIQAQMHLEFLNCAWNELHHWHEVGKDEPSEEGKAALKDEISCRTWAALYLVQLARTGSKTADHDETIKAADAYNGLTKSHEMN